MKKVYLDYNATTPVLPEVREAMLPFLDEEFGNPSSLHRWGARARKALEETREKMASGLACDRRELLFTGGGTESVNLALKGTVLFHYYEKGIRPVHVITTTIEHKAVLKSLEELEQFGLAEVTRIGVDGTGALCWEDLERSIRSNTVLISVMWVNNETGGILPVERVASLAHGKGILFHTDATQAVGKIRIDCSRLPVDLLSFAAHKFYGPKGVGGLFVRQGVRMIPLIRGGGQELERRGGTENLPGIIGMGAAWEAVHRDLERESSRVGGLRDRLEERLRRTVGRLRIYGDPLHRVGNTLKVSFEGVTSETILVALDREGIAVSSGSACASGAINPSHVLLAMGVDPKEAKGAVRFSLGRGTTEEEIDYVLEKLPPIVERLRQS